MEASVIFNSWFKTANDQVVGGKLGCQRELAHSRAEGYKLSLPSRQLGAARRVADPNRRVLGDVWEVCANNRSLTLTNKRGNLYEKGFTPCITSAYEYNNGIGKTNGELAMFFFSATKVPLLQVRAGRARSGLRAPCTAHP